MGLGLIIFILAVLVFLTLFIIGLVKAGREWGAFQIVLLCILFIESWVFLYFTAGVHSVRVADAKNAFKEKQRLIKAEADVALKRYGLASASDDTIEAVVPGQGKLDRLTIDRGRIWRQASFVKHTAGQDSDQIQISLQAAVVAAPADATNPTPAPTAASGRSLPQNMVVYAFQEEAKPDGPLLPVFYLGEYKVVASDETSGTATLESTRPLFKFQQDQIKLGMSSLTLFEMLPIDSHHAFVSDETKPSNEEIFGHPDEEKINELFGYIDAETLKEEAKSKPTIPKEVLRSYLRDGKQATDTDPPETLWTLVRLLKDVKRDVDSDQSADATQSGYFDNSGRAVDIRLKRGEEVTLNDSQTRDNRIVVIEAEAKRMITEGVAEKVQSVYVRPLNDYEELFDRFAQRAYDTLERIKYYKHQSSLVSAAQQDGQNMVTKAQQEKQLMDSDISNYSKEIEVLNTAVAEANADIERLKSELSKMYKEIQSRREKLVSTSR